jgi:tight adherence protein C
MDLASLNEALRTAGLPEDALVWIVGIALTLACLGIAWWASTPRSANDEELVEDDRHGIFGRGTWLLARVLPDLLPYKARRDLLRCGYLQPHAYDSYLALRNALVIGTTLTFAAWLVAVEDDGLLVRVVLIGGVFTIMVVYSLPRLYLNWRGDQVADATLLGLPDALDAVVMGLSGGLPVQSALERAASELTTVHPQLAGQLKIVRRQAAAGTLPVALDRWAARIELDEVTALASLVSHAAETGSSIAGTLRNFADTLRSQRMQRVQERSNRVAIQMLFPTVLCLAPATYIVLLAPPLLNLEKFREVENRRGGLLAPPTKIGGGPEAGVRPQPRR